MNGQLLPVHPKIRRRGGVSAALLAVEPPLLFVCTSPICNLSLAIVSIQERIADGTFDANNSN
jgi:hypothetical protein